ncbi:MAG: gas vesicle protein GvpJ [Terriglobales bacterium]
MLERIFDKGIVVEAAITISLGGLNAAEYSITLAESDFLRAA